MKLKRFSITFKAGEAASLLAADLYPVPSHATHELALLFLITALSSAYPARLALPPVTTDTAALPLSLSLTAFASRRRPAPLRLALLTPVALL